MGKTKTSKAMSELGSYGGKATLKKHGKGHFKKIVKSRWDKERKAKEVIHTTN